MHGDRTHTFLERAAEHLAALLTVDRCVVSVLADGRLRVAASCGMPAPLVETFDGIAPGAGVAPVVCADVAEDPSWEPWREGVVAAGLRSCWSVPLALPGGEVKGTFAVWSAGTGAPDPETLRRAADLGTLVAIGLDGIDRRDDRAEGHVAVVSALTAAVDVRDEYTADHSRETARLSAAVGRRLRLPDEERRIVDHVAVLHDVGKLAIPTELLGHHGPLDEDEWALVRQHPIIGERIVAQVPGMDDVARAIRHEHERWDGGGYPDGLSGERIPMASRIVFACDAYHAMTSDRPYRPRLDEHTARAELRDCAGSQFDPRVVRALLEELRGPTPVAVPVDRSPVRREALHVARV